MIAQLLALGGGQSLPSAFIYLRLSDPAPHDALSQVEIPAHLWHRLARAADERDRLSLELLTELTAGFALWLHMDTFLRVFPSSSVSAETGQAHGRGSAHSARAWAASIRQ
jgi:hypothetical protein